MAAPLNGLRVIDLTTGVAGPYATKLLADYGADVVKVEPPGGDPTRSFGPFPGGIPHAERSGQFLHLNTNKRSVVADVRSADGRELIRRLATNADVLVEDLEPGQAEAAGWGWDALRAINPRLTMASITPFGQTGPYVGLRADSDLVLQAMGGALNATGSRDREPLKLAGDHAQYHAGITLAGAILLGVRRAEAGGPGDWIDLAIYECQAGSRDRRAIHLTVASYTGMASKRDRTSERSLGGGIRITTDGYVNIQGGGRRVATLLRLIGREDLLDHPGVKAARGVAPVDFYEQVEGSYYAWLAGVTKKEAAEQAQAIGLPAGPVNTIPDLVRDEHFRGRGMWDVITHPEAGTLEYAGRPFIMHGSPRPQPRPAPLLDQHRTEVERDWSAPSTHGRPALNGTPTRLPLEGIRVADLTVVWAGPQVTQLLSEWGAEVIRAEPVNHMQASTRYAETAPTPAEAAARVASGNPTMFLENSAGDDPWNRSAQFNTHARNKKSFACDLMSPEGREAFLRLIAKCDVLVENNVRETLDRAKIDWEVLKEINPRLIMLRMPAFGLTGPYVNYRAYGEHVESYAGHVHLRSYPDDTPEILGNAMGSDAVSGVQGLAAVMMGLRHRDVTGEGQLIEMPLSEGFIPTLSEFIMDYSMNGYDTPSQGNQHRWHAPHNVYPCAGEDQWIAIDIANDEEFATLGRELGSPLLAADPRFATAESRRAHRGELDAAVSDLTRPLDKMGLFRQLQDAGLCAGPVLDAVEALADPQLNARGYFEELETAGKPYRYPGLIFRMAGTPNHLRTPPCKLGEHNHEIYCDLLGYTEEGLAAMQAKGLVDTAFAKHLLRASVAAS